MKRLRPQLLLGVLLVALGTAGPAWSAIRFVATTGNNTGNNCIAADSPCRTISHSLTQASANDTVSVAAGTYDRSRGETFPLVPGVSLTMTGVAARQTVIDATGANTRVVVVNAGLNVAILEMTITGGNNSCVACPTLQVFGGGIFNNGTLTLTNSTVSGNTASCTKGSLVTRFSCFAQGGGLFNFLDGSLTLANSTVSGNTATCTDRSQCSASGGGLFNYGTLKIINSTVSGNAANGNDSIGGGILNTAQGSVALTSSTLNGNTVSCTNNPPCGATGGGLINHPDGSLTLLNSIVAGNAFSDCKGPVMSAGFNLDTDNTCKLTASGDKPGVSNPLLGPLADNGGPTQTHALLPGSPAIDAVTNGCPPPGTDQRGVTRPVGRACDMGAYETGASEKPPVLGIPTLSGWAELMLLGLLLLGGLRALRRRRQRPTEQGAL